MELLLVEGLVEDLRKDTAKGTPDEEAVARIIDVVEVAEAEVGIGWEFLQGVVLLLYLLLDLRSSRSSR